MIIIEKKFSKGIICLNAITVGSDLCVSVFGGDKPHIGAVALASPRVSLDDPSIPSSSASVMTISGHKEDLLARELSLVLSSQLKSVVSVSMGIHIEKATQEDIESIISAVTELGNELIEKLSSQCSQA